ncbi:DUF2442 domain-containing protein [Clostridium sp. WILCCON 0269]|uniref:DUF2442 domain-containing protein n=1 Tax=Candidatus Clostridium eludens TaxID=3381663 RepID=A0ABW8SEI3_9CLOT
MDYFPEVIQVIPTNEYEVYIYFDDGAIKLFDASELVNKGIFNQIKDKTMFMKKCTVLNGTLAWDLNGNYDESECLDIDPFELYNSPEVEEPIQLFESFQPGT